MLENAITVTIWPLYLGVFVLVTNTYAVLGILAAVSTALALVAIMAIGKLIDKQRGKQLLDIGAYLNAVLHLFRPFVVNPLQALGVSILNEPITAMYRMPFLKGRFDASDSVPGYRIIYFMISEYANSFASTLFWGVLALALYFGPEQLALQATFVLAAILSICITRQRFSALQ
jgi:hypothetical protein